jgi:hypothetical protein
MSERKTKVSEEDIQKHILEAKRTVFSAIEHGKITLETLDQQDEMIQNVEDTLEANDFVIQRSFRALRGMTWSGYIANKCSDVRNSFVLDTTIMLPSSTTSGNLKSERITPSNSSSNDCSTVLNGCQTTHIAGDDDLNEISSAVDVLHRMGVTLGEQLDSQKTTLDRIEDKTNIVTDHTLAVTLRTSQLLRKTHKPIQSFVGTFQFIDAVSNRFLSISLTDGASIAFTLAPDLSSYFHVFVKQDHLFGLLNEKTQRYLGCTVWGTVAASGEYFGGQEECYVDLGAFAPAAQSAAKTNSKEGITAREESAVLTGLLFAARHWGAGGWLRLPTSFSSSMVERNRCLDEWVTTETTTSITDRMGAMQFKVVRCRVQQQQTSEGGR